MYMTWFCVASRRKARGRGWDVFLRCVGEGLKFNAGKNKVMALGGEDGLEREVSMGGIHLEQVSEFKYFGCFG